MMDELKNHWNALPARTRQLLVIGGIVVGVALLYSATWLPLQRDLARLRVDVPRETEQLNWMRTQAPTAKAMRARMSASTGPVIPSVEQSANTHGVRSHVTKIDAEGSNGARVTLDAVPFNALIMWISELQATQGLVVDDATIDATATPGIVNARLRLRTGGA